PKITAEKVPEKFPNRKITITPEIQTTNTTKNHPRTICCGIAVFYAVIPQVEFFASVIPCR
ncbi:MAG: hypothetical protein U9N86_12825, partial [Bacteroidota bacterium]|nr:hypothetical protein [Bacteroidota bacterium]